MEIYLLRHGEAGNPLSYVARDLKRSLTAAGRDEVREVAKALPKLGIKPDKVASSPLRRASETAEIVAEVLGTNPEPELWDELKPETDRKRLYSKLSSLGLETEVMLVGHEPFLTAAISDIIGAHGSRIVLKKAGLARVTAHPVGGNFRGELRWLLSPKVMKAI